MCKYINDKVENQLDCVLKRISEVVSPGKEAETDSKGYLSTRKTRKLLLSARGHLNNALKKVGEIERIRYDKARSNKVRR